MPAPHQSPFARVVRPLAKERFGTRNKLAQAMNLHPSQFSDYIGGSTTMPDHVMVRLCAALGVSGESGDQLRLARDLTASTDAVRNYVEQLERELEAIDSYDCRLSQIRAVTDALISERQANRRPPPFLVDRDEPSAARPSITSPSTDEDSGFTKL